MTNLRARSGAQVHVQRRQSPGLDLADPLSPTKVKLGLRILCQENVSHKD